MTRDRVRGMLLGAAIGDAFGMPLEILSAETISARYGRVTTFIKPGDNHKFFAGKPAGYWTDDMALTLAILQSFINKGRFDMDDIAQEHINALEIGGDKGFGNSTKFSILNCKAGAHWSKSAMTGRDKRGNPYGTGNGISMKIAPLSVFLAPHGLFDDELNKKIAELAWMTHKTGMALASGLAHAYVLRYCLSEHPATFDRDIFTRLAYEAAKIGESMMKDDFKEKLSDRFATLMSMRGADFLTPNIRKTFDNGTCFVYNSLPFTHAFFLRNFDDIESLYDVANAGGDTDSNASMLGALLGALHGESIFPKHLVDGLWQKEKVLDVIDRFCDKFEIR